MSLETFCARYSRLAKGGKISALNIDEALWLSVNEFKSKYGMRRTTIDVDGQSVDIRTYFDAHPTKERLEYANFRQRVCALKKKGAIDGDMLTDALTLNTPLWITFYGGGRHKGFVYNGEEYPDLAGKRFHGVAALLRTIGRYAERSLIWSRLKAGWRLGDALSVPVDFTGQCTGSIYRITRVKTGAVYVGLTRRSVEQRWAIHQRRAAQGENTKLCLAIREDGAEGFEVDVLEGGIDDSNLPVRESHWVELLGALGENGLNTAKPGGMGSPRGKTIEHEGERFRSIEEAAAVLGPRFGLKPHIVRTRLQHEKPLPKSDQVRQHSSHPDAGGNLFRRWLQMRRRAGSDIADDWATNYDKFKADVSPVPARHSLVRKADSAPWGSDNFEWVNHKIRVERVHGKGLVVNQVWYPSLKEVAGAYHIGVSTLKNRISCQGMSVEQAVAKPLAVTSCKRSGVFIVVDGNPFRSKRQAILHIAETRGLTEHQAKYQFSTGSY